MKTHSQIIDELNADPQNQFWKKVIAMLVAAIVTCLILYLLK